MGSVAALTVAFNEERLIKPCVKQFKKPYLAEDIFHLVLVSRRPWRGSWSSDNTIRVAYESGADKCYGGDWKGQAEQFNWGLEKLAERGYDWAIICDADEFYTPAGIKTLLHQIDWADENCLRAMNMAVYWKTPERRIYPEQTDGPIIAIRTDQKFIDKRWSNAYSGWTTAFMNHFSYVRTDEEMLKKIQSFEHSHEFNLQNWYDTVWTGWEPKNQNLHPVVPEQFKGTTYWPAPDQILKNYYEN